MKWLRRLPETDLESLMTKQLAFARDQMIRNTKQIFKWHLFAALVFSSKSQSRLKDGQLLEVEELKRKREEKEQQVD